MKSYPSIVKKRLTHILHEMAQKPELFVKNPGKDFTRKRKLTFEAMIRLLLSMGGNSICKELLEANRYHVNTATASAFIQQRGKLLPFALGFLLHEFTQSYKEIKTYRGYRLCAVDGSDLHIPTNPKDSASYFENHPGEKGFSLLHLNTLYDLCNRMYLDTCIQARRNANEHHALTEMVDRCAIGDPVILVADRGYESYNNFAHIEQKGWNYVIRVRDNYGIISCLTLPDLDEFDETYSLVLSRKQTLEIKTNKAKYRFLPSNTTFDFMDLHFQPYYPITLRVVRFRIPDGSCQTVITNLDPKAFPASQIKEIYKTRWGIETSFRELKYAIGLLNFHAKKTEYIEQEIFANLILYNFSAMITSHVAIGQRASHCAYQVNFTAAIYICRYFFSHNILASHVEALIQKNILPVRPGRASKRNLSSKSAVSFLYRVA